MASTGLTELLELPARTAQRVRLAQPEPPARLAQPASTGGLRSFRTILIRLATRFPLPAPPISLRIAITALSSRTSMLATGHCWPRKAPPDRLEPTPPARVFRWPAATFPTPAF